MLERRKTKRAADDGRPYDEVKAASASAADRIAKAAADLCDAFKQVEADKVEQAA